MKNCSIPFWVTPLGSQSKRHLTSLCCCFLHTSVHLLCEFQTCIILLWTCTLQLIGCCCCILSLHSVVYFCLKSNQLFLFVHSLFMQSIKLNSRIITTLGICFSILGLILIADWQSIPYDCCTEFSLHHHPERASGISSTSLPPCLNVSLLHNTSAVEEVATVATMSLRHMEPFSSQHPVVNQNAYNIAMNICESLSSSQYHCHWIPDSVITHRLCHACPPICRSVDHTLNFVQYMIGAVIFRISIPIPRIGIMMVISDVVSRQYQVGYERWSVWAQWLYFHGL